MNKIQTAEILIEALPYIQKFSGKSVVIKVGGSTLDDPDLHAKLIQDVVLLKYVGVDPILVHGGGKHINSLLTRLGKKSEFINGLRVTDKETVDVTQAVLAGLVNKDIVAMIRSQGGKAVGISGKDADLIIAKKMAHKKYDYGHVGEIVSIDTSVIKLLETNEYIPVISPIASDLKGNSLNINADLAATEIAVGLKAEKLIFLTDTDGVLLDINDPSTLIQKIKIGEIASLVRRKVVQGGMIPKLKSAADAIKRGINAIHIINGKKPHSLLLEILTDQGVGTQVTK